MVDKRINLIGVGFFGPRDDQVERAKYLVTMRIQRLWMDEKKCVRKEILAFVEKSVAGIGNGIFSVDFDRAVALDPSALRYTIGFKLVVRK